MATLFMSRLRKALAAVGFGVRSSATQSDSACPLITSGSGAASASDPNGSARLRTDGLPEYRISGAWKAFAIKDQTWDSGSAGIKADVIAESTSAAGVTVDGMLVKDGGFTAAGTSDLNGAKLILDADADTSITADTDDQIDVEISGADDFRFTANTFTALAGSTVATDTISETTSAAGVTIDGVLLKDGVNRGTLYSSNVFLSTEQTGNGGAQNVAHGLGAVPALVFVIPSDLTGGAFTVAYGAHDSTNAVATVTTGEKYRVIAFK